MLAVYEIFQTFKNGVSINYNNSITWGKKSLHVTPTDWLSLSEVTVCFSERSKRRTKSLLNTNHPQWNQSFVYQPVRRQDLKSRVLEVTVWDYDRFGANEFLGEMMRRPAAKQIFTESAERCPSPAQICTK